MIASVTFQSVHKDSTAHGRHKVCNRVCEYDSTDLHWCQSKLPRGNEGISMSFNIIMNATVINSNNYLLHATFSLNLPW